MARRRAAAGMESLEDLARKVAILERELRVQRLDLVDRRTRPLSDAPQIDGATALVASLFAGPATVAQAKKAKKRQAGPGGT